MRVFVGTVEIAGVAGALTHGLRQMGLDVHMALSTPHPFEYGASDSPNMLLRLWRAVGARRAAVAPSKLFIKIPQVLLHTLLGWFVFLRYAFLCDAFLFTYGRTFTGTRLELYLLRLLRKKIIFIFMGSDIRPPYIDGGRYPGNEADILPEVAKLLNQIRRSKRDVVLCERYADYVIASPTIAHFLERPYINWFALGLPKELRVGTVFPRPADGKVRILHGPSNPLAKGSPQILEAIARLQAKGHPIELMKIEYMPNQRVLEELARCDFVIDQLYADSPLAAFATEAAYFGKPAVVGSYFAAQIRSHVAAADIPPSLFVMPDELEAAVERLILDPQLCTELGERARQFVTQRWNTKMVAERYLMLLKGDVPADWWCDPRAVRYLEGSGLPRGRAQRLVASLLAHGGVPELQVTDKPDLERAFCEFAGDGSFASAGASRLQQQMDSCASSDISGGGSPV